MEASKNIHILRRKVQDLREEISTQSHIIYKRSVELDDLNYFKVEIEKLSNKYSKLYRLIAIQNKGFTEVLKVVLRRILKNIKKIEVK